MDCTTLNAKGEDNRLNNWKKWIQIRKEFHQKMFKIQCRRPSQLLLNSAEDERTKKEIQQLHEYSKIPEVFSNRGKPSFWDFPPSSRKFPSLHAVRTKAQDYEIPEIENIGVPTHILREKGVLTSEKHKYPGWFNNEYLRKRNKELQHDLRRVQSYQPHTEKLIVTGSSYEKIQLDREQIIKTENLESSTDECSLETGASIFEDISTQPSRALQIEGATFAADGLQEIKNHCISVNYEIGIHDVIYNRIEIRNIGRVAIRYYWHRRLTKKTLEDILPNRLPTFGFIFMKNENIVLPCQTNSLTISFKTNKPGMYKEIWQLKTVPNVFEGKIFKGEFFLKLNAFADIAKYDESQIAITNRLEEGMKFTAIAEAISKLWQRTAYTIAEDKDEGCRLTEKDLFEAVNAKFGPPGTLPFVYHYNEEIVKKLRAMYKTLRTDSDAEEWNYKIDDIENLIQIRESQNEKDFYKFTFDELVRQIHKTSMIENEDRDKYQNVYLILCAMVDRMSEKIYNLRCKFKIPFTETYPAVTEEVIFKQVELDDNCRSNLYFTDPTAFTAIDRVVPCKIQEGAAYPLEALKFVPFEDIEQRYKIYHKEKYGIEMDEPKDDKGKKGKGKKDEKVQNGKGEKKPKEDKKKKESIRLSTRKESVFKEKSLTELLSSKTEIINDYLGEEPPDQNMIRLYHYSMYVTIYCFLCQAATEIECVLEHLEINKKISRGALRKCIELGIPTFPPTEDQKMNRKEFKALLGEIDILSTPTSDMSVTESVLTDISKPYSESKDEDFFNPLLNMLDMPFEVEMVDAQTETDGDELFPPKIRIGNVQTDADDEEFDLVAQIERELSATSVQYFKRPTESKATQVELNTAYLEEEQLSED